MQGRIGSLVPFGLFVSVHAPKIKVLFSKCQNVLKGFFLLVACWMMLADVPCWIINGTGWMNEYACVGTILGDYEYTKTECVERCVRDPQCECVTWLKDQPDTPCRLEDGSHGTWRGDGAQFEANWDFKECYNSTMGTIMGVIMALGALFILLYFGICRRRHRQTTQTKSTRFRAPTKGIRGGKVEETISVLSDGTSTM